MEWIKIEDKKPEYDTKFLMCLESGNIVIRHDWACQWEDINYIITFGAKDYITHWMELPEPPVN